MKGKSLALLTIFCLLLNGCGTICNFASGHPEPYGGVSRDVEVASHSSGGGGGIRSAGGFAVLLGLGAVEFWASAVADTLTFPFLIWHERRINHDDSIKGEDYRKMPVQFSTALQVPITPPDTGAAPADSKQNVK